MKKNYHAPFQEAHLYHVYNRSNNREVIFPGNRNILFFMQRFYRYIHPYMTLHAFVIMKNHFHFLLRVREISSEITTTISQENTAAAVRFAAEKDLNQFLEDQFKRLFSSYAKAFNREHNRNGSLFQKRFKRIEVTEMDYVSELIYYIHQNPVRDGYTRFSYQWPWSSGRVLFRRGFDLSEYPVLMDEIPHSIGLCEATSDFSRVAAWLEPA